MFFLVFSSESTKKQTTQGIKSYLEWPLIGRDEATRTPDPYVPNVVRYQLRYIPMAFEKPAAKVLQIFELRAFLMENFGILSVLHYLCRRKLTEMKQVTLIIACVWMTLATYAQRTIILQKNANLHF